MNHGKVGAFWQTLRLSFASSRTTSSFSDFFPFVITYFHFGFGPLKSYLLLPSVKPCFTPIGMNLK